MFGKPPFPFRTIPYPTPVDREAEIRYEQSQAQKAWAETIRKYLAEHGISSRYDESQQKLVGEHNDLRFTSWLQFGTGEHSLESRHMASVERGRSTIYWTRQGEESTTPGDLLHTLLHGARPDRSPVKTPALGL